MNLNEMIEAEIENGYGDTNAQAKVCQDIILKAISSSSLSRNVTIKGGVVMRSKTGNIRRATQDLDMDFIRYSLADEAIDSFIRKLNCLDEIAIQRTGPIEDLKTAGLPWETGLCRNIRWDREYPDLPGEVCKM